MTVSSVTLIVDFHQTDNKRSTWNLTSKERVEKYFDKAYKSISHSDMKDQCRQRIQQKGWQVDPTALRILKETRRPKWFGKRVKDAAINHGLFKCL